MWQQDFDTAISGIVRDTMPIIEGCIPNFKQCDAVRRLIKKALYNHMDNLRVALVEKWGFPQETKNG